MSPSPVPPLVHPAEVNPVLIGMLDAFVAGAPTDVISAVLATDDGLVRAASSSLERARAEHVAAQVCGLSSLVKVTGRAWGLPTAGSRTVRQLVWETNAEICALMAAANGTLLAVRARLGSDVGAVAHGMGRLITQVRPHLVTPARPSDVPEVPEPVW